MFCIPGVFYECLLVYMFYECVDEWCVWCVFWFICFISVLMSGVFGVFLVYMFSECVDEWCVWCVLTSYTQSSPAVTLSL